MSGQSVEGVVSPDPIEEPPDNFTIRVNRLAFPWAQVSKNANDWTAFGGVLLKLVFGDEHHFRVMGSGVMIAPGVALAARHVIEPELEAIMAEVVSVLVMAVTPGGLEIWRVHQVVFQDERDVVLLVLRRASPFNGEAVIAQAQLSTRLSPVGEIVSISGFVAEGTATPVGEPIHGRVHISQGTVSQHFLDGRDRCMLPGPCFAVKVGTPGGVSGGPVFNAAGRLIGLLSTSTGTGADDVSFVSMLHPILIEPFRPCWPKHLVKGKLSLLDYDVELCAIEGRERIAKRDGHVEFAVWS